MPTAFEFWNGCTPFFMQDDGQPMFGFDYPPFDEALLGFFQISARISEIETDHDWLLFMEDAFYDVPDVPEDEIAELLITIGARAGYEFELYTMEAEHPTEGLVEVPVGLWINLRNGLIEATHPVEGTEVIARVYEAPPPSYDYVSQDVFNITINEAPPPEKPGTVTKVLKNARTAVEILQFFSEL